jgi:hypothetical protein
VDARGRVISWDPEELTERSGDRAWQRSFRETSPSVEAWLGAWVEAPTPEEQAAARQGAWMIEEARRSRAAIAAMSVEERRKLGLPDVGWEKVVWGGIGLDEDDQSPS